MTDQPTIQQQTDHGGEQLTPGDNGLVDPAATAPGEPAADAADAPANTAADAAATEAAQSDPEASAEAESDPEPSAEAGTADPAAGLPDSPADAESDAARSDAAQSDAAQSDTAQSDTAQSDTAQSDPATGPVRATAPGPVPDSAPAPAADPAVPARDDVDRSATSVAEDAAVPVADHPAVADDPALPTIPVTAEAEHPAPPMADATLAEDAATPATDHPVATAEGGHPPTADAAADRPAPTPLEQPTPAAARTPAAPLPEHAPIVRPALADPAKWGRVDEDRTVYVRTADGERAVGSWQAGEPEEGLAHFARRFDDLLTEVELIATRLDSGHGDPKQSLATIKQLREGLDEAHVVGDVVGLAAKLDYLVARAEQAVEAAKAARDAARAEATARKRALVEEAEKIATEATQWKTAGDRLRAILDEWKTVRGVDRKTDDALWKRFGKARDAFNRRRGSHFAEMDRQRGAAKVRKEEIVAEAERLADSTEWGATAGRYKQLMAEWKAAGRAPKDADDALWQRFRAAQDAFFAHRSSAFNERDSELTDNARRKEQLLAEAERIDPSRDLEAARAQLHRLQERWDAIGHVPRERMRELESRLRAIEERVRGALDAQWRRSDPEAQARVDQFRERVEQFEAQAAKARAAGDERRAKRADEQAAQWREWLAAAEQAVADR